MIAPAASASCTRCTFSRASFSLSRSAASARLRAVISRNSTETWRSSGGSIRVADTSMMRFTAMNSRSKWIGRPVSSTLRYSSAQPSASSGTRSRKVRPMMLGIPVCFS